MSGFGSSSVSGRNRLPRPAAKTNACRILSTSRKQRFLDFVRNDKASRRCSLFQIERARTEVDNAMVAPQRFCAEQTGDGRGTFQQAVVNQSFEINDANVLAKNIYRTDRKFLNMRDAHAALFQIHC